jgi:hypothetical protein
MVDTRLTGFVQENLRRGVPLEKIKHMLRQHGYHEKEVNKVIRRALGPFPKRLALALRERWEAFAGRVPITRKQFFYLFFGGLVVALLMLMYCSRKSPPVVSFMDDDGYLAGSVYYNDEYLGDTKGTFNKLPAHFCRQEGKLVLKTAEGPVSWGTDSSDCRHRKLKLTAESLGVKEVRFFVTLRFVSHDGMLLSGKLYIDGQDKGFIGGIHNVPVSECTAMRELSLIEIDEIGSASWGLDPEYCENDEIIFRTPRPPVEIPDFEEEPGRNISQVFIEIQEAVMRSIEYCEAFCPQADEHGNCTQEQKYAFCKRYVEGIDFNANGEYDDFLTGILDDYGACEDRVYCSFLTECGCRERLSIDSCIDIVCEELRKQVATVQEQDHILLTTITEGGCRDDIHYVQEDSWWSSYKNRMTCGERLY